MKIIHIEDFFHPDAGYQINLLSKYQSAEGNQVYIVCGDMSRIPTRLKMFFGDSDIQKRDKLFMDQHDVRILRVPIFKYYSGRAIYKPGVFKLIKTLKPDLLYVHGNDSLAGLYYTIFSNWQDFPVVFDNHMLEMASKNKLNKVYRFIYRNLISKIIKNRNLKVIRVVEDDFIIKQLGIPEKQSPIVPLGTDTMHFFPDTNLRKIYRKEFNIPDDGKVFLYMGKLTSDKGVMLLAEAFLKKIEIVKDVILVVVGTSSSEYGDLVIEKLKKSENKVVFFPTQKYSDLAKFYQLSDFAVYPKHCSLSFFDAQAVGLPVIFENNNINYERLKNSNGFIFASGDIDDLRKTLIKALLLDNLELIRMKNNSINYIKENGYDYARIMEVNNKVILEVVEEFRLKDKL